jgi:hypothetical protein
MIRDPQCESHRPILIFLSRPAARFIATLLVERGYAAIAVSSVPELFDALRNDVWSLAITGRRDVAMVRNIKPLPVINLEIFLHKTITEHGAETLPKTFDIPAFLRRIDNLMEQRPVVDTGTSRETFVSHQSPQRVRPNRSFGPKFQMFWQRLSHRLAALR